MKVVVYSHDADTRAEMKLAIGTRPAPDAPEAEIIEVATAPALFRLLDAGGVDVMVLDGEAQPAGGMGVSRQAKDEIYNCPPALLVIARADDRWLATWSKAEAVISHPIDPAALARELAALMRARVTALPAAPLSSGGTTPRGRRVGGEPPSGDVPADERTQNHNDPERVGASSARSAGSSSAAPSLRRILTPES